MSSATALTIEQATYALEGAAEPIDVSYALDELVEPGRTSLNELCTIAKALSQTRILVPIIESALADPTVINTISTRSYQFYGQDEQGRAISEFTHIGLATGTDAGGLVTATREINLHLWNPDFLAVDSIHRHSRLLGSAVAFGEFKHQLYRRLHTPAQVTMADGPVQRLGMYEGQVPTPGTYLQNVWLETIHEETVRPGETHGIWPDLIHEVTLGPELSEPVGTINVRRERQQNGRVFADPQSPPPAVVMHKIDARQQLEAFAAALSTA